MIEKKIKVVNPLGLHARAAALLVRTAGEFQSQINLKRTDNGGFADAKSILSVLTLAAAKGTELEISVSGADETEAFAALESLFAKGFGEL